MTDLPDLVRAAALVLPDVEERDDGFYVGDTAFVHWDGGGASILTADGWAAAAGDSIAVEDRVAAAWELAAPRGLLEAGGR
jgi:hypothetical protein